MKLKMIVTAIAVTASAAAFAKSSMNQQAQGMHQQVQTSQAGSISFAVDSDLSQHMLNNQEVTGSALKILHARQSGEIAPNVINIGGRGEMYAVYQKADGKPSVVPGTVKYPSTDSGSMSGMKFPFFDLTFTGAVGDWTSAYVDLRASDISSSDINLLNVYFVVGNLDKAPVYGFAGKKVVEFGDFSSANNFMPTLTRAYFMAYGAQAGVGYAGHGVNAVFTLMNGNGKYLLNSKASNANQLNNFALSATYNNELNDISYHAGAGYINATGFSRKTDSSMNSSAMVGAFDLNAGMEVHGLSVNGELLMTIQGVHGMNSSSVYQNMADNSIPKNAGNDTAGYKAFAFNALPVLVDFNSGSSVKAWSLDAAYIMPVAGKDMVPYFSYNHVVQNAANNLYQLEVGSRYNVIDAVWVGGSYGYISGKSSSANVGNFNTVMLNTSVYF